MKFLGAAAPAPAPEGGEVAAKPEEGAEVSFGGWIGFVTRGDKNRRGLRWALVKSGFPTDLN